MTILRKNILSLHWEKEENSATSTKTKLQLTKQTGNLYYRKFLGGHSSAKKLNMSFPSFQSVSLEPTTLCS